ncbi:MAG: chromosomal replication initiator protein DnaA [Clostridia bacterium]|nr:chromosomal replication initiator protein DnaA [Clostridia bacterium]
MSGSESIHSLYQVWIYTMQYLQENYDISEAAIDMWIGSLSLKSIDNGVVHLEVNTDFQKNIIDQQYGERLQESFSHVLGFPVKLNIVSVERKPVIEPTPSDDSFDSDYFFNRTAETGDYTFENFIVGASNRFAHAASLSVASNPAGHYNPLFIYGGSGLGKTHLLYAICAAAREKNPHFRVLYTKCEEMTNDFIKALADGTIDNFRKRYRQADILLVDDIQFLAGKTQTQEEFFHTFDYLHNAGRQIVITSDRPPREIATLEDRLRGRFEMGLLADIQPPDLETRIAIIKRKAYLLHMHIADDVCEYIASQLKSNVRQLEGVVKTMHAQYLIGGNSPTLATAQNAIRDIRTNNQPTPVTIDRIISEVSRTFNVSAADILSKSRTAQIARARQVAIFVVRSITGLKQEEIGKEFGGFDHTTVLYSLRKVDEIMQTDPTFKNTVNDIIKNLSEK